MKLSFDTRFCTLPATGWTFPLAYLPLSASCTLSEICKGWLPSDPPDVRIFLHSCCTLLLSNYLASFVFLLSRNPLRSNLHYFLIVWQTISLPVQFYIWYQISNYQNVAELVHLLPLCLTLLCLETCYATALSGSIRLISSIFSRAVCVAFHIVAWLMLLLSLTCAVHREYIGCSFIP